MRYYFKRKIFEATIINSKAMKSTVSLSCFDHKRYVLENGITSYAHGHKNIPE